MAVVIGAMATVLVVDPAGASASTGANRAVDPPSPAAATIQTSAKALSPAAPGARAAIDATVLNTGLAQAAAPVTVTVSGLPAGASLVDGTTDDVDTSWSCTAATGGGVCTLVTAGSSSPAPLGGESVATVRLSIEVANSVTVGTGLTATVATAVGPATTPAPDLTKASTSVELSPLAAGVGGSLLLSDDLPGSVEIGKPLAGSLTITNLGPSPIGGTGGTVTVGGLVPATASAATASGPGWSCSGAPLTCS